MQKLVPILPQTSEHRAVPIKYETYEYRMVSGEVKDVEAIHHDHIEIPELDFLSWIEFCVQLQERHVQYDHYYMKEVIPYDPERNHPWEYFTRIDKNRLYHKATAAYQSEMLFYYIKDFDYYVMIRLESHRGQLMESAS